MRNKRKLLVGLASLTLFDLSAAAAADLPLKARMRAPVAAPTVVDWSGLYIGGHVGYRWADAKFSSPAYDFDPGSGAITFPARNESFGANTPIVGVQAGYNYMLSPTILAGVEGDWSWGSGSDTTTRFFSGSSNDGFTFRGASELELTWQATIRGRLGVVNGPWLFYGTGGVAFLHAKWTDSSRLQTFFDGTTNAVWSTSKTLVG